MKIKLISIVAFLAISLSFYGCKKEKAKNPVIINGELTFQGVKYPTNNGYILKGPKENTGRTFFVIFSTNPIVYDTQTTTISGTTNLTNLYLVSSSETELSAGTYKFINRPEEKFFIGDAWFLEVFINYNFDKEEGDYYGNDPNVGEVIVKKTGSDYDITYTTTYNNHPVKGYYKGKLKGL